MNKNLARAKAFVSENRVIIAAASGAIVGAYATAAIINQRTFIELTEGVVNHMLDDKVSLLYKTPFGDVILSAIPK